MCYIECVCTTVPGACAAVMSEVGSCCRELVEIDVLVEESGPRDTGHQEEDGEAVAGVHKA